MNTYKHSVQLDVAKCSGCTTCLRHCPTEAIRIRDNHAVIDENKCIDCGECIRVCPHKAKKAVCGTLEELKNFKWKIALPAPTLYGQFENLDDVDYVLDGLKKLGFDDVYEVSAAAEEVSAYTRVFLKNRSDDKTVISSACPVVLRLIALRFPSLKGSVLPMLPPMEVAAINARKRAKKEHPELSDTDIGVFFISPCTAKVSYVNNGFAGYKSAVDVVIPIRDVYFSLINVMDPAVSPEMLSNSGVIGISWATSGGESTAIFNEKYLAADGIENVIHILDQVENDNIPKLDFIELNACTGGCVGGVLTIQNPFIAKARLQGLRRYLPVSQNNIPNDAERVPDNYLFKDFPSYRPISMLSDSMIESLNMMSQIQKIKAKLPGIDCASCGAPNCRSFAEDLVKDQATLDDCPILKYKSRNFTENKAGE